MKNIRLLEDRVSQVVARLRQVTKEKRTLLEELDVLRQQFAEQLAANQADENGEPQWKAEKAQVAAAIEATLAELRVDG